MNIIVDKMKSKACAGVFLAFLSFMACQQDAHANNSDAIQAYTENSWYWQYQQKPLLLIGGSGNDNLFQWEGRKLTDHLDLLKSTGGNYVRNTMSDRDDESVYAVKEIEEGVYDLNQWNDEYWNRLKFFLDETKKREIIVQLTLWDWFDLGPYQPRINHPYYSSNNVNWQEGTIESAGDFYGGSLYRNNEPVLTFQNRYVDKLLSITLAYDHIIYNVNNESSVGAEWENHWAKYLKGSSKSQGKNIYVTSMQLLPGNSVRHVMTNKDLYSYAEVSQNNQDAVGAVGRKHYDSLIYWRGMIEAQQGGPMPINNVKIYGAGEGENRAAGTGREAIERFWRNIFAGAASSSFHRAEGGWGIGLSVDAQHALKSASMFLEEFDIFRSKPYKGCETIGNLIDGDYCLGNVGNAYAVYLPAGKSTVVIDPWVYMDEVSIKWLNVTTSEWEREETKTLDWAQVPGHGPDRVLVVSPGNTPGQGSGDSFIGVIKPKISRAQE